ncbi:hypothetical protein Gasu2_67220 [Galdieria sulphuraria]|nr:hypothetical protein Gasu2_67220 [Galdieria sulphuraria]
MERDSESSPQESCPIPTEMECFKEQMKELNKRINSLFQSEEQLRNRLQKVANEAENTRQNCLSKKKWQGSYPTRGKENSVDAEYAKEVVSKLLGEMNKLRAYWMQEMQLRHCCQNELLEYKNLAAGMDASSVRTSEVLEYYKEQATRYKQTLLSTTKWCIWAVSETAEKMNTMVQASNHLKNFNATTDRIQIKLKVLYERNNEQTQRQNERLQRSLQDSNNQLSEKLDAVRNEIQWMTKALVNPSEQRNEELKQWLQGVKQEIRDQLKGIAEMDKGTGTNQESLKLLEDLKDIGLQLQNIGNKMEIEKGNGKRLAEVKTNSNSRNFKLIKWSNIESLQPNYCPFSVDKLSETTIVSIPPHMDANKFSVEPDAKEPQKINNSSAWKVFKIQSNRRVGAIHTRFQVDQDNSIRTSHNDTSSGFPTEVNKVPYPKSSHNRKKAPNRSKTTKGSKKQASKGESSANELLRIATKDKIEAAVVTTKQGNCDNLAKEQDLQTCNQIETVTSSSRQGEEVYRTLQKNDSKEQETRQKKQVKTKGTAQQKLEAAEQRKNCMFTNILSSSTDAQQVSKIVDEETALKQEAHSNHRIARSSKCFGKKRKSSIIDEYELTAETCSQKLPLSFFQSLQI